MVSQQRLAQLVPAFPAVAERFDRWRALMRDRVTFTLADSAWHTKAHCERALLYALVIGQQRGVGKDGLETLAACAAFHDTRRNDDGLDVGHGARAAAYYRAFAQADGVPANDLAAAVMAFHDRDDAEGEAFIAPRFGARGVELYRIFKDADGLDRFRLGPHELDPRFLRTEQSHALIDAARTLART